MNMTLCSGTTAEISYLDKEKREWRYPVDLEARTCNCRQWQITGLPCIHALFFITSLPGPAGNIQQYVHDYYSVARFKATYAYALPAMEGKQQWDMMNPEFKLCAPVLKRAAGRQGRVESDLAAKELDLERGSVSAQGVVGLDILVSIVITQ